MSSSETRERYFWIVLVILVIGSFPVNEIMRYLDKQDIKDNTDANFAIRAQEHLRQEKNQFTMINNQKTLEQNDQILYDRVLKLEQKIDSMLNASIR